MSDKPEGLKRIQRDGLFLIVLMPVLVGLLSAAGVAYFDPETDFLHRIGDAALGFNAGVFATFVFGGPLLQSIIKKR